MDRTHLPLNPCQDAPNEVGDGVAVAHTNFALEPLERHGGLSLPKFAVLRIDESRGGLDELLGRAPDNTRYCLQQIVPPLSVLSADSKVAELLCRSLNIS